MNVRPLIYALGLSLLSTAAFAATQPASSSNTKPANTAATSSAAATPVKKTAHKRRVIKPAAKPASTTPAPADASGG